MSAPAELIIDRVRSASVGAPGRSLNSARNHHFVIDEPAHVGGPGEEITPAEAFLAGVSGCGVLLVQKFAAEEGIPLERVEAQIEGIRRRDNPADFQRVNLRFELVGPTQAQAVHLVERFQQR